MEIVQVGQHRALDLSIEVPGDELGAVATNAIWDNIYDRMTELALQRQLRRWSLSTRGAWWSGWPFASVSSWDRKTSPRTMAVFRGSSASKRSANEERRNSAPGRHGFLGAGHRYRQHRPGVPGEFSARYRRRDAARGPRRALARRFPKGRFFATTRDDLVESAALIRAMRAGVWTDWRFQSARSMC